MSRMATFKLQCVLSLLVATNCAVSSRAAEWRPTARRSSAVTVVSAQRSEPSGSNEGKVVPKPLPVFEVDASDDPIDETESDSKELEDSVPEAAQIDAATAPETDESSGLSALDSKGDSVPLEEKPSVNLMQHLWGEDSFDWVFRGGGDRLGFFSMKSASSRELDFFDEPSNFSIDFRHGFHFLSGPEQPDMPPRLYDLYWNVRWLKQLGSGVGFDANFDLGLFTDFEDSVRKGWRFPGRALAFWNLSGEDGPSEVSLTAGIEYFDMDTINVLPAGGVIWQPDEETRFELYFPRPQVKLRLHDDEKSDCWLYLRGDLIGSAWAIERTTGNADVANLLERRVSLGFETRSKEKEGGTSFIEIGYLFHRELEYHSGVGNQDLGNTMTFRLGSRY